MPSVHFVGSIPLPDAETVFRTLPIHVRVDEVSDDQTDDRAGSFE